MADHSVRFIILNAARTGSTMLRHLLNSHPEICCHGEVMAGGIRSFVGLQDRPNLPLVSKLESMLKADPVGFMRDFVLFPGGMKAVGFKIKYEELVLPEFAAIRSALEQNAELRVIHLRRENRLKRVISKITATRINKVFNVLDPSEKPVQTLFALDPKECEEDFTQTADREEEFTKAFASHPMCEVGYEELVHPDAGARQRVQEFLGVAPVTLETATVKINSDRVEDMVENLEVLRAHFANTPWAKFF